MAEFRLLPLLQYAEERRDTAARDLQKLRQAWLQEEEKLAQLKYYLNDYHDRLSGSVTGGVTVHVMRDFQRFIGKLELAIDAQNREILRCQQQWEIGQQLWMEREREVKTYETLRSRHEAEELAKAIQREQRLQDEFSQNQLRRRSENESG